MMFYSCNLYKFNLIVCSTYHELKFEVTCRRISGPFFYSLKNTLPNLVSNKKKGSPITFFFLLFLLTVLSLPSTTNSILGRPTLESLLQYIQDYSNSEPPFED